MNPCRSPNYPQISPLSESSKHSVTSLNRVTPKTELQQGPSPVRHVPMTRQKFTRQSTTRKLRECIENISLPAETGGRTRFTGESIPLAENCVKKNTRKISPPSRNLPGMSQIRSKVQSSNKNSIPKSHQKNQSPKKTLCHQKIQPPCRKINRVQKPPLIGTIISNSSADCGCGDVPSGCVTK